MRGIWISDLLIESLMLKGMEGTVKKTNFQSRTSRRHSGRGSETTELRNPAKELTLGNPSPVYGLLEIEFIDGPDQFN